jgi:hypothetical protein
MKTWLLMTAFVMLAIGSLLMRSPQDGTSPAWAQDNESEGPEIVAFCKEVAATPGFAPNCQGACIALLNACEKPGASASLQACDRLEAKAEKACRQQPACHDLCTEGAPQIPTCDPCVASICADDPFCCDIAWDGICVDEVSSICGLSCD